MIELSRHDFEALRSDSEFILYRGQRQEGVSRILVLAVVAEYPMPQSLKRLEHECSLKEDLDPAWAARPIELARHCGRTVLVLENPGGELLDQFGGFGEARSTGPHAPALDLGFSLRIGINLANAIGHLHRRGIVHKDIKPANVLVDSATGQVWLMGFGIASRLPRERQSPDPPEFLEGTLAYMAPEQTGRMNRSIDSRSDLYSLGVTLYQMLTGSLPFAVSDPMEWVHCHIARKPEPPSERLKNVPAAVSAIIMKLLAKTAEERYQTAAGVESDLRRCLSEWERALAGLSAGALAKEEASPYRIAEFRLGEHDVPDRLLIPEKLYGRASEIEILLASFDRVVTNGKPELVLVSGYSGIGKSSVVNELHNVLVPPRGLFASGKFDQYKRDIPYSTLAQAFQSLVRPLLSKSEAELLTWRDALSDALDPNVTNMNTSPGTYVTAGVQLMALVDTSSYWVAGYFKETQLPHIKFGQNAIITMMGYEKQPFLGVVRSLGWGVYVQDGSGSTSTSLLPAISPTIDWVRLPQRFAVRIQVLGETPVLSGDPHREKILTQLASLMVEALAAAGQIRIAGCSGNERKKLVALIHTLQVLVSRISQLVFRRNLLPEVTEQIMRLRFDHLEIEFKQTLDAFAECFPAGDCSREFPTVDGALTETDHAVEQMRDRKLLGKLSPDTSLGVLDLVDRYHAIADALAQCGQILHNLRIQRYWGVYVL